MLKLGCKTMDIQAKAGSCRCAAYIKSQWGKSAGETLDCIVFKSTRLGMTVSLNQELEVEVDQKLEQYCRFIGLPAEPGYQKSASFNP